MRKSKFKEGQIVSILKEAEMGIPIIELCRTHGISNATFYKWRSRYGGMTETELRRLRHLEEENRRLKQM